MIEVLESRIAPALVLTNAGLLTGNLTPKNLVATDASGNIFVVVPFTSTIDADLGPGNLLVTSGDAAGDLLVAKYSPDFTLLWAKTWGGAGAEQANALLVDDNGDLFVTGSFASTNAKFSGTAASISAPNGVPQTFLLKFDGTTGGPKTAFSTDGQMTFGNGTDPSSGNALKIDNSGQLLIGGDFLGSNNTFDGGSFGPSASDQDGFVGRLDATNGTPDANFGPGGALPIQFTTQGDDSVFRIEVGGSGDLFIGVKTLFAAANANATSVLRLNTVDLQPVSTYGDNGFVGIASNVGATTMQADFTLDSGGLLVAAQANGATLVALRFDDTAGHLDTSFGQSGVALVNLPAGSVHIQTSPGGQFYLSGEKTSANYVARLDGRGDLDTSFSHDGIAELGAPNPVFGGKGDLGLAIDPQGYLILRDSFTGNPDLDPSTGVTKLLAGTGRAAPSGGSYLVKLDTSAVIAGDPFIVFGNGGDGLPPPQTVISMTGPGRAHVTPGNGEAEGDIDSIELFNTTLASGLSVTLKNPNGSAAVAHILTHDAQQDLGSVTLGPDVTLGFSEPDAAPELLITGKASTITLHDINPNAFISLGKGLPYNVPNNTTIPDTYNNRPNFTADNILGPGVVIDVTGDGMPGGVGGGGFGKVTIGSWGDPGLLRTTQSIGSFTVLRGDFYGTLEVDKFHLGEATTANVGTMTVQNGAWGGSGTEVEGNIGVFNAEAFLAGASITAGSIGTVTTQSGQFDGTLTLTDAQANTAATFVVQTNFTGKVVSASPLKRLIVKGDFTGSLEAPSIASITAFSFIGTTVGDGEGDPTRSNITTTAGLLGLIRAQSGVIKDYELTTPGNFSGIKVVLGRLNEPTVAIDHVSISAANIGPITVQLTADAKVPGVDLTGIRNSQFTTTGKLGAVNVKLNGASGNSVGLDTTAFSAATMGNVTINVNKGKALGATAHAIQDAEFTSTGGIGLVSILGDATTTQAQALKLSAGRKLAGLTIKAKTVALGTLQDGYVLAGQAFNPAEVSDKKTLLAGLASASLGPIKVSGSLNNTIVAAGGSLGAITVGGDLSLDTILAGAVLGADKVVGGGDDLFHRAGQIAAIVVKGTLDRSTVATGVNPADATFGNGDDLAAADLAVPTTLAAIKSISIGTATVLGTAPVATHNYAIEAGAIGKLTVAGQKFTDFTAALLLDGMPMGEGAEDVIVRVV